MRPLGARLTSHAITRMAQRGLDNHDIDLIQRIATEVEDGYFVREKDFLAFEREVKALLEKARKLVGKRIVVEDAHVITAYHASRRHERRLLRNAEDSSLRG